MNFEEQDLYDQIEMQGFIYRKFLNKKEIKICNKLVKDGLITKGKPDERNATIAYYIK